MAKSKVTISRLSFASLVLEISQNLIKNVIACNSYMHCVKSAQMRSFFVIRIFLYSILISKLRILMSIEEDLACYKPKTMHNNPCYFSALVAAKHEDLTCHDDLMLVLEYVEHFSVRSKNACMIALNINLAIELVSLESSECTHKEVFFRMQLEDVCVRRKCFKKINVSAENASRNIQKTSFVFYLTYYFRCL